jgi:hypothetical protein
MTLSAAELEQRRNAALKHGTYSERRMRPRVAAVKLTFRRQTGLRARDFSPVGRMRLDLWASARAKRQALDRAFERGDEWSHELYVAVANAERLAFDRLEPHIVALLEKRGGSELERYLASLRAERER